jgi:hypothetical protein
MGNTANADLKAACKLLPAILALKGEAYADVACCVRTFIVQPYSMPGRSEER